MNISSLFMSILIKDISTLIQRVFFCLLVLNIWTLVWSNTINLCQTIESHFFYLIFDIYSLCVPLNIYLCLTKLSKINVLFLILKMDEDIAFRVSLIESSKFYLVFPIKTEKSSHNFKMRRYFKTCTIIWCYKSVFYIW